MKLSTLVRRFLTRKSQRITSNEGPSVLFFFRKEGEGVVYIGLQAGVSWRSAQVQQEIVDLCNSHLQKDLRSQAFSITYPLFRLGTVLEIDERDLARGYVNTTSSAVIWPKEAVRLAAA
jgi:hypothetical protein